ncbi:hypothetical protein DVS28_b0502 (plasmid) [Euzebya pacifica]|uniref:Uncharacterized protein n=1 Tax=Euzebya pacifica TaxID=1608957 RepID=A0A346Y6Z5_9ACTN|nr:hypothetical protein [Euzebya pacifica]AXV10242.1 hypothetical protein DVS28_b0502 [Euzebya pacifica]
MELIDPAPPLRHLPAVQHQRPTTRPPATMKVAAAAVVAIVAAVSASRFRR